jgi:hypothetical protein
MRHWLKDKKRLTREDIHQTNLNPTFNYKRAEIRLMNRVTALYIGCKTDKVQNFQLSVWLPIYRMSWDEEGYYYYSYTQAFKEHYPQLLRHILNPDCGFNKTWKTKHLDERFGNRIPRRSDGMKCYDWLGIPELKGDFITYLAGSGGKQLDDDYEVFPEVVEDADGYYNFHFPISNEFSFTQQDELKNFLLKVEKEQRFILCEKREIGCILEYINYLINCSIYKEHQLVILRNSGNAPSAGSTLEERNFAANK